MSNTDEERRKLEKPTTTVEQAALLASSLYNVPPNAPLKPLDSYDDRNFYVPPSNNSEPFLLKVHNGVESDNTSILQAQDEIMKYLAKEGFNCSQPIASIHGRTIEYTTTSQRRFAVRALKWVNGKTFNSLPPTPGKKSLRDVPFQCHNHTIPLLTHSFFGSLSTFRTSSSEWSFSWQAARQVGSFRSSRLSS